MNYITKRAWFVFPTPVGVFLSKDEGLKAHISFPHACGGVSDRLHNFRSPLSVFPTPVGVFLISITGAFVCFSFPHACGGVSVCIC